VRVVLSIGGGGCALALTIRDILQAQAEGVARELLLGRELPPLYSSGVRYKPEPNRGTGVELFDDPWTVWHRGWGDCDDLVIWRCGEILARLVPAGIVCKFRSPRYHVAVRKADGSLEDPSKVLIAMYGRLD